MLGKDSITVAVQSPKPATVPALVFVVVGAIDPIQWAEHQQRRQAAIDSNQSHRAWLAVHGLSHIDPSELFAG